MNLELYRPAIEDLWFRRDLLADGATMSYNRAWGGTNGCLASASPAASHAGNERM